MNSHNQIDQKFWFLHHGFEYEPSLRTRYAFWDLYSGALQGGRPRDIIVQRQYLNFFKCHRTVQQWNRTFASFHQTSIARQETEEHSLAISHFELLHMFLLRRVFRTEQFPFGRLFDSQSAAREENHHSSVDLRFAVFHAVIVPRIRYNIS
jgi:hypothetical protein